uniref:Chromodomain protein putative n=1 Tax=Albugo laibachii Nc14 TaxID=890382 RepID=F0WXL6_9STRA|nr:chromodomain protein putative [Albugo laibachii Nc14]|eukprot:CCA26210.1 chromodomain protein putative [Albugo laibachii Nc14]
MLPKNKLQVNWIGPFQVIACYEYSYRIRHLLTGEGREAHHSRLHFYRDAKLMVTKTFKQHVANQDMLLLIEQIQNHRWNEKGKHWELLVKWQGLEDMESSWEPLKNMARDVPTMAVWCLQLVKMA